MPEVALPLTATHVLGDRVAKDGVGIKVTVA